MTATTMPPGRVTGLDGKTYPRGPLPTDVRRQAIWLAHDLRHDGLPVRAVAAELLARYGLRRSVGTVHADLTRWRCGRCVQVGTSAAPEHDDPGGAR